MTCIVGLIAKDGTIYMGADSAACSDDSTHSRKDSKLFLLKNKFLIGYAGSFRAGQSIQYCLTPPNHAKNKSNMEYFVSDFIDALKELFKDKDIAKESSQLLIGYQGELFEVDMDFNIGRYNYNYYSIGSGADIALGSLYATQHVKDPKKRLLTALQASAHFNNQVRAPFTILSI